MSNMLHLKLLRGGKRMYFKLTDEQDAMR